MANKSADSSRSDSSMILKSSDSPHSDSTMTRKSAGLPRSDSSIINKSVGILLTHIGTPKAPTPMAVCHYLKKFLSDPRVVQRPQIVWRPILYGVILPFRSKKSARLYQTIWTKEGPPLLLHSQKIADKLQAHFQVPVLLGMQYSAPSISHALKTLQTNKVGRVIVLPLYPQYSAVTTASTFDHMAAAFRKCCIIPEICTINDYSNHPYYIEALCHSIQKTWQQQGKKYLLFSFHGIPKRYVDEGDPYLERCQLTTHLIADRLKLKPTEWSIAFQSRLGKGTWLTPYTDQLLQSLPKQGITELHVICPGFAVDCLETLEEIAIRGKEQFLKAGGKSYYYIPALNDSDEHIAALADMIKQYI
jgi:protoporphyrin/coproporphyrin ferrochelatase